MPPLILSPRRRHLFSVVACPIVVICPRIVSSSPSLVPLVVSSGRGAVRGDVIRIVSSARCWQASRQRGDVVRVIHIVRAAAGSVLIAGRLVQSKRTGGASSSMPWDKQAGNGGWAMSSSLCLVRPSRGVRLVSSTLVRLVRRDVGRGVARCRSCGNVGKQAGGGGLGFASSSRLCLFGEHQFDIRIPWGRFRHPRALALLSLISKLGRHRPAHIVIRPISSSCHAPCSLPGHRPARLVVASPRFPFRS